jgi:hypothetical protein
MKRLAVLCLLLGLAGCVSLRPTQPIPPQPRGATCESAHANMEKLGGCGVALERFVQDCHDREQYEADRHYSLPLDCITEAGDCDTARACN